MNYLVTFLEGLITFISPCVLPLLPVYVLYFAGDETQGKKGRAFLNAVGFVTGFSVLFMLLGIFASGIGSLLIRYQAVVNLIMGAIVILFGLHYTGFVQIALLNKTARLNTEIRPNNFFSSMLFGAAFAIGWSPCTGTFLGSALMIASQQAIWLHGMFLLLAYSLGLGVPFILCALLIDSLKNTLALIKQHYRTVNMVCGAFLILIGILMATGVFSRIMVVLN
ncbi:MAG: cytochrome c biogenesis protein CcdA [Intestinimonas sp.]|jgi:cytochrome c-type biogenesis protein|nr:cytochrome c biogenesis protein CcdA [Intestinimonas sp.]